VLGAGQDSFGRPGLQERGLDRSLQHESDIHVRLALQQTDSKLLRAIEEAIVRLDQGVYGICMDCEEEIAAARLDAVPWTRVCINCKERQGKS